MKLQLRRLSLCCSSDGMVKLFCGDESGDTVQLNLQRMVCGADADAV